MASSARPRPTSFAPAQPSPLDRAVLPRGFADGPSDVRLAARSETDFRFLGAIGRGRTVAARSLARRARPVAGRLPHDRPPRAQLRTSAATALAKKLQPHTIPPNEHASLQRPRRTFRSSPRPPTRAVLTVPFSARHAPPVRVLDPPPPLPLPPPRRPPLPRRLLPLPRLRPLLLLLHVSSPPPPSPFARGAGQAAQAGLTAAGVFRVGVKTNRLKRSTGREAVVGGAAAVSASLGLCAAFCSLGCNV